MGEAMSDTPGIPRAQAKRLQHLEKHRFHSNTCHVIQMERDDGKKCLVDRNGMVYWMYADGEIKSD